MDESNKRKMEALLKKKTWTLVHYPKERRQLGEYRSSQLNIRHMDL
jgi:hypothetical protein